MNKVKAYLAVALSISGGDRLYGLKKICQLIPTTEEMPTPEKYKNQRKVKNKMKKKRGY